MTARIFQSPLPPPPVARPRRGLPERRTGCSSLDQSTPAGSRAADGLDQLVATMTQQGEGFPFETSEEAIAYCERNGIPYRVEEPKLPKRRTLCLC